MAGLYGVDESKKIVQSVATVINVAAKAIKGNVLALFELVGLLNTVRSVNFDALKLEVGELDQADREAVEQAFAMALDLPDATLEQKIVDSADTLNEAVDVVVHLLTVVDEGKAVYKRIQDILSV